MAGESNRAWVTLAGVAAVAILLVALVLLLRGPEAERQVDVTPLPVAASPVAPSPVETAPSPPVPPPVRLASAAPLPARPGSVSGIVTTLDGKVAGDVTITLTARGRFEAAAGALPSAMTGADGRFHITGLAIDFYVVSARGEAGAAMEQASLFDHAPHDEVVLILRPGAPIGGMVVSGGEPVAGARIAALTHDGQSASRNELAALIRESDGEGRFLFESMAPTAWGLYVTAPGFAPVATEPIEAGTEDAVIELAPGAVLEGVVIDSSEDAPLAGVTVTAQRVNYGAAPDRAATAADGSFRFDGLAADDYVLNLDDPLLTLRDGPMGISVLAEDNPPLELSVSAGGVVRGRVIDRATRAGVAGVRVLAAPEDHRGIPRRSAPSDETGAFVVRGVSAGSYRIQKERTPGYNNTFGDPHPLTVQVRPGETIDGIELVLDGGIRVSGTIVFPDGSPAAGALAYGMGVRDGQLEGWQDQTTSGPDGSFVLAGVGVPGEITISAAVADFENEAMGPFFVPSEGLHDLRLMLDLPKDGLVAGIVVDERGAPLAARVMARQDGRTFPAIPPIFTAGSDGQFLLMNMAPGPWRLLAALGTWEQQEVAAITLAPGEARRGLRLVYTIGDREPIGGTVTDRSGKPLRANIEVHSVQGNSRFPMGFFYTDPEGRYVTGPLEPGIYNLTARSSGYRDAAVEGVEAGSEGVDIVLDGGLYAAGQVVDERGRPVTNYEIAATAAGGAPSPSAGHAYQRVSDPEGRFRVTIVSPANHLCVRAPGYRPECFRVRPPIEITPVDGLVLTLTSGGARLTGVVTNAAGAPVSLASVFAGKPGMRRQPSAVTANDGAFAIDPAEPGLIEITVTHPTEGFGAATAELADGRETAVNIVLTAPGQAEGVVHQGGAPIADTLVRFTSATHSDAAFTDETGTFRFGDLPAGPGRIEAEIPGGGIAAADVTITPGEVVSVTLDAAQPAEE